MSRPPASTARARFASASREARRLSAAALRPPLAAHPRMAAPPAAASCARRVFVVRSAPPLGANLHPAFALRTAP